MPPTDKSFGSHQSAVFEADLRLIEKLELIPFNGLPQLGFLTIIALRARP